MYEHIERRRGVEFAVRNEGRVLIGDEMGLGKTVQAIAAAHHFRHEWPVLVVCPSSLRLNWVLLPLSFSLNLSLSPSLPGTGFLEHLGKRNAVWLSHPKKQTETKPRPRSSGGGCQICAARTCTW